MHTAVRVRPVTIHETVYDSPHYQKAIEKPHNRWVVAIDNKDAPNYKSIMTIVVDGDTGDAIMALTMYRTDAGQNAFFNETMAPKILKDKALLRDWIMRCPWDYELLGRDNKDLQALGQMMQAAPIDHGSTGNGAAGRLSYEQIRRLLAGEPMGVQYEAEERRLACRGEGRQADWRYTPIPQEVFREVADRTAR